MQEGPAPSSAWQDCPREGEDHNEQHPSSLQRDVHDRDNKLVFFAPHTVVYMTVIIVCFAISLAQQVNNSLFIHVLSSFGRHHLTALVGTLVSLVSCVLIQLLANNLKTGGYLFSLLFNILCSVLLVASKSPSGIISGQILCFAGCQAILYILDVIICDIFSLQNLAWRLGFSRFPYFINAFTSPFIAQRIHQRNSWRLAYGIFGVIIPIMCAPLIAVLLSNIRNLVKLRITTQRLDSQTLSQGLRRLIWGEDLIGVGLFSVASTCILASFTVLPSPYDNIKVSAKIWEIVLGVSFCTFLVIWESVYARHRFAAFHLLLNPTILGACLGGATLFLSLYCLEVYFLSYIQIVYNVSTLFAGYTYSSYAIAYQMAIETGNVFRDKGKFKHLALGATIWHLFAVGSLLYTRQYRIHILAVIGSEMLIAVSWGIMGICGQMAVLAANKHTEPATALALLYLFTNLGAALGQAISSAIYTYYMPRVLQKHLPADVQPWGANVYRSMTQQMSYPMSSPIRQAIVKAYEEVMRHFCITGLCVLPITLLTVLMWKDIDVKKSKEEEQRPH